MYPRVKRLDNYNTIKVVERFYTESFGIEISKEKCIGCGLCINACPNNVISSLELNGKIRIKTEDLKPEIPDITKCSFCGTCAYICPVSAIKLKKDGKEIEIEQTGVVSSKVVPKLESESVFSEKFQEKIKKYFVGEIKVNWDKCVSCMSCVEVCPVNAFTRLKKTSDSKSKKVSFKQEKCIGCGTCARACQAKAITYKLNKFNSSGDFKEIFWNSLLERVKVQ